MCIANIQIQQRKELKVFQKEKRIALKKLKGTHGKGKNWKQILASSELEWSAKELVIRKRHITELDTIFVHDTSKKRISDHQPLKQTQSKILEPNKPPARLKAISKRERLRENRKKKQLLYCNETNDDMPSSRELELKKITEKHLRKLNMTIHEIQADGNCLYRAIAHQLQIMGEDTSFKVLRRLCAEELLDNKVHYEPFVHLQDVNASSYEQYVDIVRDGNHGAWGGHLELRALACRLGRRINVYDACNDVPFDIKPNENLSEDVSDEGIVRLSFHRFYFALGEHYNSVVPFSHIT